VLEKPGRGLDAPANLRGLLISLTATLLSVAVAGGLTVKSTALFLLTAVLAACATPYQEVGTLGGVGATHISSDTVQITARGNGFTDPDTIQRYALRKAAEETVASGYDLFSVSGDADRTDKQVYTTAYDTRSWHSASLFGTSFAITKPGQTLLIRLSKYPKPDPMPANMFDARDVLQHIGGDYVPKADR